jgi:hypothetical protein
MPSCLAAFERSGSKSTELCSPPGARWDVPGGVFVQTESPPELDQIVTVSLRLPGSDGAVETKGVVVHRVSPEEAAEKGAAAGMGVQFLDASDQFRAAIERAIDHILKHG